MTCERLPVNGYISKRTGRQQETGFKLPNAKVKQGSKLYQKYFKQYETIAYTNVYTIAF